MTPHRIVTAVSLFLLIAACISTEALLSERITTYYEDQNPKIMWQLSSDNFRNGITEKEYVEYFERHNYIKKEFKDVVFSIEEISIAENKARVKMRIRAKAVTGNAKMDEILYDRWVFEHDNWYMYDPGRTE